MGVGKSTKGHADRMGQCQSLFPCNTAIDSGDKIESSEYSKEALQTTRDSDCSHLQTSSFRESGNDSGHSSVESLSLPNRDSRAQRCSHSSESSGKFSCRGSMCSHVGDPDLPHKSLLKAPHYEDLPVFEEKGEGLDVTLSLELPPNANLSRESRGSHGSCSSGASIGSFLSRSKNYYRWFRASEDAEISPMEKEPRPRRTVSLRLPRSRYNKDLESKVPTVYIEDEDASRRRVSRKSSLRKALSLLSLNTLLRETSGPRSSTQRPQKQTQRILRRPTRRHTTVRGISGLAIDAHSQAEQGTGLQTITYYPTNTSLRTSSRSHHYPTTYS